MWGFGGVGCGLSHGPFHSGFFLFCAFYYATIPDLLIDRKSIA